MPTGKYRGQSASWLTTYLTALELQRTACLTAGQSYSNPRGGFNRVAFQAINDEISDVLDAQQFASGTRAPQTLVDMRS